MPNRSSSALGFSGYESPTESNYNGWPPTDGEVSFPASPAITRSNTPRPDYHPHHPQTQNRHVQVQLHHPQPQRPRFSRLSTANTVITTAGLIEGGNGNGGFRPASLDEAVRRARNMLDPEKVRWRDRVVCYRWTWFTMTMVSRSCMWSLCFEGGEVWGLCEGGLRVISGVDG